MNKSQKNKKYLEILKKLLENIEEDLRGFEKEINQVK